MENHQKCHVHGREWTYRPNTAVGYSWNAGWLLTEHGRYFDWPAEVFGRIPPLVAQWVQEHCNALKVPLRRVLPIELVDDGEGGWHTVQDVFVRCGEAVADELDRIDVHVFVPPVISGDDAEKLFRHYRQTRPFPNGMVYPQDQDR